MADPAVPAIRSGYLLPDYVREIGATYYGLRTLRLMISELRPDNREDDVLRAIEETLRPLARDGTARLFRLPEGDYLLCFHKDHTDAVRALLVRLRFLVPDDPLAGHFNDPAGKDNPLLRWSNLERNFDGLRLLAERYEAAALAAAEEAAHREGTRRGTATSDAARAAAEAAENEAARRLGAAARAPGAAAPAGAEPESPEPEWRPIPAAPGGAPATAAVRDDGRRPLDADILDRLENGLARADLSNHVRRQMVCALVGNAAPQPLFAEVFVSVPELRDTIAPRVDLTANRWLFQHFTETLDRRVLAWLNREGVRLLRGGFSININVGSILSEHFLKFEQVLAAGLHGTVVLELRVEDIFADLEAYAFARDFVHQRGYRLCIDHLTPETLAPLDRARLGADLVKLFWTPDLPQRLDSRQGARLAERLCQGEGARAILARCDDPAAIEVGRDLGITMFQGRHIDGLLAPSPSPSPTPSAAAATTGPGTRAVAP